MPPRAIKHQLTCPFKLTSGSFLIGRRRILVIPRNHLGNDKKIVYSSSCYLVFILIIGLLLGTAV